MNRGIFIKSISVKGLGPIQEFNETFGNVNLIYSKNERGKSFLTEFIIKSLFKKIKKQDLRSGVDVAKGKILVSGILDTDRRFSPSSKKKLDHLIEEEKGFPPSLKKLLIIKSGAVEIDGSGVDKNTLSELLTGRNFLMRIDKKLTKSFKEVEIDYNPVKIKQVKKFANSGKNCYNMVEILENMNNLWRRIIKSDAITRIIHLENHLSEIKERLDKITRAKRYYAFYSIKNGLNLKVRLRNLRME